MLLKQILMYVLFAFFVLGIFDRAIGCRFGIGQEFTKAMNLSGLIILSVVGMVCLTPVLSRVLVPVITPLYTALGADAAMFAPNFISIDSGGYSLAVSMADDPAVGRWAGICIGSMLGANLSFNIPVMLSLVGRENHRVYSVGALCALIAAPFGCVVGGLVCGLRLAVILRNLLPVLCVALCIALAMLLIPNVAIKLFLAFSRFLMILIAFGMALAVMERMTGLAPIAGVRPLGEGMLLAGTIVVTASGALSLLYVITRFCGKPLRALGDKLGLNETAFLNILMAVSIIAPGGASFGKMNFRGKVVFAAVSCTAANLLGAHLGFVAAQDPDMLPTLFVCKLTCAVIAIPLALFFARRLLQKEASGEAGAAA